MKPAKVMQGFIAELAQQKAKLDLAKVQWFHLKFELPHFHPLVIEQFKPGLVSVAHYREQNYDLIADPEVIFWQQAIPTTIKPATPTPTAGIETLNTAPVNWWPIEITHPLPFGTFTYAEVDSETNNLLKLAPNGQIDLADFVESWADALRLQGWLQSATLAECSFNPKPIKAIEKVG